MVKVISALTRLVTCSYNVATQLWIDFINQQ